MNIFSRLKLRRLAWLLLLLPLAWALRGIPFTSALDSLAHLNPLSVLALIGINIVILLLFSMRWWVILKIQGRPIPYLSLVSYRLAAFSLSYFSPGPQFGGEPLQVHMLSSRHAVPFTTALASVTLDKLLELLANFTFLLIGVMVIVQSEIFPNLPSARILPLAAGLLAIPVAYLAALWLGRLPLSWLLAALAARLKRPAALYRAARAIFAAETQISTFCRQKPLAVLLGLSFSLLNSVLMVAEYWLTLHFLGLPVGLPQAIGALTAARFAFLLPVPGGLGALEASQVLAMQALGFNPALGVSISLLVRMRDLSLGAAGLVWIGLLSRPVSTKAAPSLGTD